MAVEFGRNAALAAALALGACSNSEKEPSPITPPERVGFADLESLALHRPATRFEVQGLLNSHESKADDKGNVTLNCGFFDPAVNAGAFNLRVEGVPVAAAGLLNDLVGERVKVHGRFDGFTIVADNIERLPKIGGR